MGRSPDGDDRELEHPDLVAPQARRPPRERLGHHAGHGHGEPGRRGDHAVGLLGQGPDGERVARADLRDAATLLGGEDVAGCEDGQLVRGGGPERRQVERRQAVPGVAHCGADRDEHEHRVHQQPSCHERQGLRGGGVEEVGVVDHQPEGSGLRGPGEEGERRRGHGEPVDRAALAQGERDPERLRLGRRQVVEPREQRLEDPRQPRERQVVLGGGAEALQQAEPVRALPGVGEQGALADPGVPAQHQHPAASHAGTAEQRIEGALLVLTADEHDRRS